MDLRYGDLFEVVFMIHLKGFQLKGKDKMLWRFRKPLYCLKQASQGFLKFHLISQVEQSYGGGA